MNKSFAKYIAALLLFGSNGVVASFISLGSCEIVLLRSFLGLLLLLGLLVISGRKLTLRRHRKDLLFICLSGAAMAADWLFLFEAYARIGVSLGMLVNYSGPAIVMALSPLIFRERLTAKKVTALAAAILGVFLISGGALSGSLNPWGLACAVLSAFSYAAMVIFNKKAEEIEGLENCVLQLSATLITVAVYVGIRQGFAMDIESSDLLPILILGLVNTGAGCYLYFSSIGKLKVHTVSICGYLEPVSAVALSAVVLHETMLPVQYLGAALIIGGAIFGESKARGGRIFLRI